MPARRTKRPGMRTHLGAAVPAVFILACMFVVACAAVALAGGYNTPTAGQSPHGSYADATDKCKVCHAVHNANASVETSFSPPEALLRTRRGALSQPDYSDKNGVSCAYCHITGSWSIKKIYGGLLSNYQSDSRFNHDDNHRRLALIGFGGIPANYAGCMSCHSVHGANVLAGYEADIVSGNPNPDWNGIAIDSLTAFCRDCHDDPSTSFTKGRWGYRCNWCHSGLVTRGGNDDTQWTDQLPPFYLQGRNGVSHIMTTTLTGNYGTQVAYSESDDCRDCHMGGNNSVNNSFPHYTSGAQFLDDAYNPADTGMDRVCLNCHVEGGNGNAYTTGIGKTF